MGHDIRASDDQFSTGIDIGYISNNFHKFNNEYLWSINYGHGKSIRYNKWLLQKTQKQLKNDNIIPWNGITTDTKTGWTASPDVFYYHINIIIDSLKNINDNLILWSDNCP